METIEQISVWLAALAVPLLVLAFILMLLIAISSERRMERVNAMIHNLCADRHSDCASKERLVDSNNMLIHKLDERDAEIAALRKDLEQLKEKYAVLKAAATKIPRSHNHGVKHADHVEIHNLN